MDSMSDLDMTDNHSEIALETDNRLSPGKDEEILCQFRDGFVTDQHANNTCHHDGSIIPSIIMNEQLACQFTNNDELVDRSRSRSNSSETNQNENSFKFKPLEKAKPGLPEESLPQGVLTGPTTNTWCNVNWDNDDVVGDHACNSMADMACEYQDASYQYQDSF